MSESFELDPVDRITVGAVGARGSRTFYLQARQGLEVVTLVLEKEHVIALGRTGEELLTRIGLPEPPLELSAEGMGLQEPLDPAFRVGSMAMGFVEERDLVLLECHELGDEEADRATARFWLTKGQLGALGEHGLSVAAQGRPQCQLCGLPLDPEGHDCMARNGHPRHGEAG
ncbi:MAG: DUF3090 family protein [Actinomycetota bacterium]